MIEKFRNIPINTRMLLIGEERDRGVGLFRGIIPTCEEDETEYLSVDFASNDKYLYENLWLLPEEVEIMEENAASLNN